MTADTAPLVKYLKADLQRIANSANEELKNIRCAGLVDSTRQAEEARVINEARAYAIRRVESTVRQLHNMKAKVPTELRPVNGVDEPEPTVRFKLAPPRKDPEPTTEIPITAIPEEVEPVELTEARHSAPEPEQPAPVELAEPVAPVEPVVLTEARHSAPEPVEQPEPVEPAEPNQHSDWWEATATFTGPVQLEPQPEPEVAPEPDAPETRRLQPAFESDDTEVLGELATHEIAPPEQQPPVVHATEATAAPRHLAAADIGELEHERLERVLKFVARQEPGLRWAAGVREDGSTLIITDLAHGWMPPGLNLPADVQLLEPGRRKGAAATMLGHTTLLATYAPGDPLGWATDYQDTAISSRPRELPAVDDLGWVLGEATHWRDGLPRMVNTLAKAGAAGTGIVDAEIDILRVYLDTARYQLLAQYPDVDTGLLLNCLLLAATEGIATKNRIDANYHFAWFQALSAPPASGWKTGA